MVNYFGRSLRIGPSIQIGNMYKLIAVILINQIVINQTIIGGELCLD